MARTSKPRPQCSVCFAPIPGYEKNRRTCSVACRLWWERPEWRLWRMVHIDTETGCWEWLGTLDGGYGRMGLKRRTISAHRWAYEHWREPIPDGLIMDHICKNRRCVNPWHLRVVSYWENSVRYADSSVSAINNRKTHCPRGHPYWGHNLLIEPNGARSCRTCKYARSAEYRARKRAARA